MGLESRFLADTAGGERNTEPMHRFCVSGCRVLICCGLALASLGAAHAQAVVPPDRPISLEEAQAIAYQNQGSVATSEEIVNQARQRVRIARAGTLPNVTAGASFTSTTTSDLAGIFGTTGLNGGSITTSNLGPQPTVQFSQTRSEERRVGKEW